MNNQEIAQVFDRIADILEIQGESVYRVLAYRRGAEAVREESRDISEVWKAGELRSISGIGEALAAKIDELLSTGQLGYYEELKQSIPETLPDLLKVSDVGPKKAARFWKELGITSLAQLEEAARSGQLRDLKGMGAKSEARILEGLERLRRRAKGRVPLPRAWAVADRLLARIRLAPGVTRAEVAGSVRRMRDTVGDIDLVVAARSVEDVMAAFTGWHEVERVRAAGDTKASVELVDGLRAQLWVHPPERFGSAWQYATGSQAHSVHLRELALDRALSLSEHGFKKAAGGEILCAREVEVYAALGLPWIPPELREDRGELEAGRAGRLPRLVEEADIRGELHAHTDRSDGSVDLLTMAEAARQAGLEYLAITDHSRSLGMSGLSLEDLKDQRREIEQVQQKIGPAPRLLRASEVEILADGRLDYPDRVLAELDLVIASVHTSLGQPRDKITARVIAALRNPHVDVLGHPTGRLLGQREAADLDLEAILRQAAELQVAVEIDSQPDRLDLNDIHAQRAAELGCLVAVSTDAHHPDHFAFRRYGLGLARRAWLSPAAVLNTWPIGDLETWLARRR